MTSASTAPTTVVHWTEREPGFVYIGRSSIFGNPFYIEAGDRAGAIRQYEVWFLRRIATDPAFTAQVLALEGKQLVCHCRPLPCHGDVILRFLEFARGS